MRYSISKVEKILGISQSTLRRYEEAEASFRKALRFDPGNRQYHAFALDAAVQQRESKKLNVKLQNWFKDSFGRR